MKPHEEHHARAPTRLAFALITVSDSRRGPNDTGGALLATLVEEAGHAVASRAQVSDDVSAIRAAFEAALAAEHVDVIVSTGGTGVAPRDVTPDALTPLLDRAIPGFGELFRMLSYQQVGTAAISSRAIAGTRAGRLLVALPGSPDAVRLAMQKLVLPEAGHLVSQARR